jgi:hypothetical protein
MRPEPLSESTGDMGFSLGGIIKGALGTVAHSIPGVSQVYDAFQAVGGLVKGDSTVGRIISTPIAGLPAPSIIAPPPPVRSMPAPNLPALPAGATGGVVKSGGTFQTPDGMTHDKVWRRVTGHYTKKGAWSNRRRPRMNPMNVRAARRAVSRIHAAEKLFRRILSVSHPGKATGHISPKRKKR